MGATRDTMHCAKREKKWSLRVCHSAEVETKAICGFEAHTVVTFFGGVNKAFDDGGHR